MLTLAHRPHRGLLVGLLALIAFACGAVAVTARGPAPVATPAAISAAPAVVTDDDGQIADGRGDADGGGRRDLLARSGRDR